MRTAEEAIAAFAGWDGTAEYPAGSNRNFITDWYGMGPVAWCAMACSRALIAAGFGSAERIDVPGVRTTSAKGWAYCPYVEADFRAAGRWHDGDPLPGDLVLYDWDGDGWSDHIGMLATVDADMTLYVWEGNTDEGVVRLKHRSRTYVRGFARPPYAAVVQPPIPDPQQEDYMLIIGDAPPERGGGVWMAGGIFRKPVRTGDTWAELGDDGAKVAKHVGVFDVGTFDDLIDIEAVLRRPDDIEAALAAVLAELREHAGAPGVPTGVDVSALADLVAARIGDRLANIVADVIHERLAG